MPVDFKGFVGQSYQHKNFQFDCQRTINLYPDVNETGLGRQGAVACLSPTPGLVTLDQQTSSASAGIGMYKASWGDQFLFRRDGLFKWANNQQVLVTAWNRQGATWARGCDNGIQLFVVGEGWGTVYDRTTGITSEITTFNPAGITYCDGYIIANEQGTNKFWHTDLYSSSFPSLNFYSAEANPDKIVTILNNNEDIWVFGESTTEVWYNAGQGNVIFARRPGLLIENGCASAASVCKMDSNRIVWLSRDDRGAVKVVMNNGFSSGKISTGPIEQRIASGAWWASTAYSYSRDGHLFYCLNIPGLDSTLVFDVTVSDQTGTPTWHERVFSQNGVDYQHRASAVLGDLVQDSQNGSIYQWSESSFTDFGNEIKRQRVTPHISASGANLFFNSLEIFMKTGVGVNSTALVQLDWSNDGGATWSNVLTRSAGSVGAFNTRVVFRQLGVARDRVFRVTVTDPVAVSFIGASLDLGGSV